jgi:hypothetical protein
MNEVLKESIISGTNELSPLGDSLDIIDSASIENLKILDSVWLSNIDDFYRNPLIEADSTERRSLTSEEKQYINNESGWSDQIVDVIGSIEEYEIYKNAGLVELDIGGRQCLVRADIDWNYRDSIGRTNQERAETGLSPINSDGEIIELHHISQESDAPLAELTPEEHRGKENNSILHDPLKESEIDRSAFRHERKEHWIARANAAN